MHRIPLPPNRGGGHAGEVRLGLRRSRRVRIASVPNVRTTSSRARSATRLLGGRRRRRQRSRLALKLLGIRDSSHLTRKSLRATIETGVSRIQSGGRAGRRPWRWPRRSSRQGWRVKGRAPVVRGLARAAMSTHATLRAAGLEPATGRVSPVSAGDWRREMADLPLDQPVGGR